MPCVLYLHGRIHHRWFPPSQDGPARRHALADASLVLDRATTLDRRGKELLLRYREYLQERHPLARVLAHASEYAREHGGEPVAISVAPSSAASAEMEVALVYADNSEDPQGPPARYAVLLPLSAPEGARHLANFVSYFSSLYDTTMYPILHPGGDGGFTMAAIPSRVDRTPGLAAAAASCSNYAEDFPRGSGRRHRFTLLEWVKALLYQSQRLQLTGRLMQEWSEFELRGGALCVATTLTRGSPESRHSAYAHLCLQSSTSFHAGSTTTSSLSAATGRSSATWPLDTLSRTALRATTAVVSISPAKSLARSATSRARLQTAWPWSRRSARRPTSSPLRRTPSGPRSPRSCCPTRAAGTRATTSAWTPSRASSASSSWCVALPARPFVLPPPALVLAPSHAAGPARRPADRASLWRQGCVHLLCHR